jgi:hypothetical protein
MTPAPTAAFLMTFRRDSSMAPPAASSVSLILLRDDLGGKGLRQKVTTRPPSSRDARLRSPSMLAPGVTASSLSREEAMHLVNELVAVQARLERLRAELHRLVDEALR